MMHAAEDEVTGLGLAQGANTVGLHSVFKAFLADGMPNYSNVLDAQ